MPKMLNFASPEIITPTPKCKFHQNVATCFRTITSAWMRIYFDAYIATDVTAMLHCEC